MGQYSGVVDRFWFEFGSIWFDFGLMLIRFGLSLVRFGLMSPSVDG